MEKALTIFIGNTVSIANGNWEGDRDHWREIKLSRYPYTFINWISDTLLGWIFGKRKDLNVTSLGNFPPEIQTLDKPFYDSFSGKITGKVRIVGADLQLNKDLKSIENIPGMHLTDRQEVENLKKEIELMNIQYTTLTEALKESINDQAVKLILKRADEMQKVKNKFYNFGDYLKKEG